MVQALEQSRFEALANPLLKELALSAYRLTRDYASAEDLVQETLLKAHRAFGRFAAGTNFKAWIYRILYNSFVSDFRRKRHRGTLSLSDELDAEAPPAAATLTSEQLEALCERLDDRVTRALHQMNPEFREILLRAALDDATSEEIAEELHLPVGTVMSRLHRARAFLRHQLASN